MADVVLNRLAIGRLD